MAVTSIWYVSNRVDDVVKYVVNPDKTMEKERADSLQSELKSLYIKRKQLYSAKKRAIRHYDGPQIEQTKSEIRDNARKIRDLKKEISLCSAVSTSSEKLLNGLEEQSHKPETELVGSIMRTSPLQSNERF